MLVNGLHVCLFVFSKQLLHSSVNVAQDLSCATSETQQDDSLQVCFSSPVQCHNCVFNVGLILA